MMSPSSMYPRSARPPFSCRACRGSSVPVSFSGPPSRKLEILCILTACSACGRLTPAGQRRVHVFQPPPVPEPSGTPRGRRRLLVLRRGLWALPTAPPVQLGTSFDISIPLLQCAWEENGTLLHALPSTQPFPSSFFVDFDSGKRFGQRSCGPLVITELFQGPFFLPSSRT